MLVVDSFAMLIAKRSLMRHDWVCHVKMTILAIMLTWSFYSAVYTGLKALLGWNSYKPTSKVRDFYWVAIKVRSFKSLGSLIGTQNRNYPTQTFLFHFRKSESSFGKFPFYSSVSGLFCFFQVRQRCNQGRWSQRLPRFEANGSSKFYISSPTHFLISPVVQDSTVTAASFPAFLMWVLQFLAL